MKKIPQLKKKKIDWSNIPEDSLLWALYWDQAADPGDMGNLAFAASEADVYLNWIVIPTSSTDPAAVDDLRPLEVDFGGGVKALWSDTEQSIMAFAFSPGAFTEEEAQAWMTESKNLTASAFGADDEILALMSFDDIRNLVHDALTESLQLQKPVADPSEQRPWILEISPNSVIYEHQGKNYLVNYVLRENKAILGDRREADRVWQLAETGENIELSESPDPITYYAFNSQLLAADEQAEQGDGLIWKEVLHPGQWYKTNTGKAIEVTQEIIEAAYAAFNAGMPRYVSVPANHHHMTTNGVVPSEENRGFIRKLKMSAEHQLFAGFDLTNPQTKQAVLDGSIADCSVFLQPNVYDNAQGIKHPWVLRHVLLTNDPLVNDLGGFGAAIPASGGDASTIEVFTIYQKGGITMPEGEQLVMSSDQAAILAKLESFGLDAEEVIALAESKKALAAQAAQLRQDRRDLNIKTIVDAMQNNGEHPSVVQIEGTRHYPVVCEAVQKSLAKLPEALSLDSNDDGTNSVDGVILGIINALPKEARIALDATGGKLSQPKTEKPNFKELSADEKDARLKEAGLDFLEG